MTRAEPVGLVQDTIKALLSIKANGDEIIVIDNNHTDEKLYEPLANYCNNLAENLNVYFHHHDVIEGYKAGALNLALALTDETCDYIVVVDSDYQALPWARRRVVEAINQHPNHALLQFPQFYRDADKADVHTELNHYFSHHLTRENNRHQALSTGTFAVIKKTALMNIGGWCGDSLTEDAQLGVLLHSQGEQTRFIPQVIATGLLPQTACDLMVQRRRWLYGNMQVLMGYPRLFAASKIQKNKEFSGLRTSYPYLNYKLTQAHVSQLTAWVNFTGVFIVLHILCLLMLLFDSFMPTKFTLQQTDTTVTLLSICYLGYALFLGRRLFAYLANTRTLNANPIPVNKRLKAWLMHINFWELGALYWLPVLWGRKKPFVTTPKFRRTALVNHKLLVLLKAVPKSMLILNIVTAMIIWQYSLPLLAFAIAIALIKVTSAWVMITNYFDKGTPKKMNKLELEQAIANSTIISANKNSTVPATVKNNLRATAIYKNDET